MYGSIPPQRVAIGNPSVALKPIEVSMLLPSSMAHMLAPPPRCAAITLRALGA